MSHQAEAIGIRYASRPGCTFLGFREVGLAVFAMDVRVLAVEAREIPPIEEFVLRFMMEGVESIEALAQLLGLPGSLVNDRLVELRRKELIDVVTVDGNGAMCRLTERGRRAAVNLTESIMQELTIPNVIYHGLLRRPIDLGSHAKRQYLRPKEAKAADLLLIRAIPNRYPTPDEFDIARLDQVLKTGRKKKKTGSERDVVAIRGILRNVYTLYEPAIMLEYETVDETRERQVAFAVDGQLQDEYETAFARANGPKRFRDLLAPEEEPIGERLKKQVSPEVIERLGAVEDVEALADRVVAVEQEVMSAKEELARADRADTRQLLKAQLETLESQLAAATKERNSRKVKYMWTPEIKEKLWEAIQTAKERLLILSGWISSEVVDASFVDAMRKALERGVRIWIGYGFDKDKRSGQEQRMRPSWQEAEVALKGLAKQFPTEMHVKDIGYTHEKRLICDNRFTFGGSFNLLSFSGERRGRGKLRHEGADLIEDDHFCCELYDRYIKMFFTDN